ncbi:MAG: GNAT family N-acetyltransferase [Deltaproteobacteria bacterium]|nr:GNAT family N-acetyltransferase [Deltaproteobacteria bacterium]
MTFKKTFLRKLGKMAITIQPFRIEAYDEVFSLWRQSKGVGLSGADSRENIHSFLNRNPGMSFLASEEDRILGTVLAGHDRRRGYIYHLAVHPDRRRQGIGRRLVDRCLQALREAGIQKCHLFVFTSNGSGIEFWKSIGWEQRSDLVVMSKTIEGKESTPDMKGKRITITAGGNREPIDPIRFIGNRSSGKMGFALAEAAQERGATVSLITTIRPPQPEKYPNIQYVETCAEMREAVLASCKTADVLIMAAAVSDFRVVHPALNKIKKQGKKILLELVENEDFFLELPDNLIKVAFAAETENLKENAIKKLKSKKVDFICANDVTAPDAGFEVDTNRITVLHQTGKKEELPLLSKYEVAHEILDRIVPLL